ncbi:putative ALA-interacting subunit 2 [Hibiscus syriacus]|uniref:ALA-interacting subunit 2 n=1 Tax=Hibiscus syriacus TaxID=106335 RepID=A0A6A3BDX0_HIBSY|nr:putative ALA-interacting subunit 2 [Hibiscus syriacus]
MRTSALPSFRKLYGRIEEDLDVDDVIVVNLMNNYNTYSFGGIKKLGLSTSSWLGGKNDFLGHACFLVGSSSLILAIFFTLLHLKYRRPYGGASYLPWNMKTLSG